MEASCRRAAPASLMGNGRRTSGPKKAYDGGGLLEIDLNARSNWTSFIFLLRCSTKMERAIPKSGVVAALPNLLAWRNKLAALEQELEAPRPRGMYLLSLKSVLDRPRDADGAHPVSWAGALERHACWPRSPSGLQTHEPRITAPNV